MGYKFKRRRGVAYIYHLMQEKCNKVLMYRETGREKEGERSKEKPLYTVLKLQDSPPV